jgi:hypothetical protein
LKSIPETMTTRPNAVTSGFAVGLGIGIPSSLAVAWRCSTRNADSCGIRLLSVGLTSAVPTFFPAASTSSSLSPAFVCGTSAVSCGLLTSHSG